MSLCSKCPHGMHSHWISLCPRPAGQSLSHWDDGLLALLSARLDSPDLYALCWVGQERPRGGPMPVSSLPSFLCLSQSLFPRAGTPAGLTAAGISSTAAWRAASGTRSSASRHSWGCCARSSSTPSAHPTSRTARSGPCPGCHSPLQSPADIGRTHEHTLCSAPTGVRAWSYLPCGLPLWRSSCRAQTLAGTGPWSCGLRSQCPLTRESRWCSVAGP